MHHVQARFKLTGICKRYPGSPPIQALNNINLDIFDHTITALVGKSGCGKSTLTRLLTRLEPYDKGSIYYFHQPLESVPLNQLRQENRILFQSPAQAINPMFKISKVISEPLLIAHPHLKKKTTEPLQEVMELMGLPLSMLEKYPSQLSGGQLQRVALARALLPKPQFLILDEPFANLDELDTNRLITYFKQLFRNLNMGFLLISHDVYHVAELAHTVIHID